MTNDIQLTINELDADLTKTNTWVETLKEDLAYGEMNIQEYSCYVKFCIKRNNLTLKAISSLKFLSPKFEELLSKAEAIQAELNEMKKQIVSTDDCNTVATIKALIDTYKAKYTKYIPESEVNAIAID